MIEKDYILRMIALLSAALAKILLKRELKLYDEAKVEIQKTSKLILGISYDVLDNISDADIIKLFKPDSDINAEKCYVIAELTREAGEISESLGELEESTARYEKALSLYLELFVNSNVHDRSELGNRIELMIDKLKHFEIDTALEEKIFKFYDKTGRYSKAEDVLFHLIEKDKTFIETGIAFFKSLSQKSEAELQKGNLSNLEVEESLRMLINRR
ncbi:MAG: hypothetical protein KJ963_01590 [Bacteroidetes bacterium]|nr:hypothetical protein [Bacteroidota bacterium]MBU1423658.1 hypothetical protein [Bacteroidota bacterium]MBU2635769.1 hypothetical protein [Bacteroidota bacterium]